MNELSLKQLTNSVNKFKKSDKDEILNIINELHEVGVIQRGNGQCHAMSDIVYKLLQHHNIPCKLEECSLMILKKEPPELHLIGYPKHDLENVIDNIQSHVVCITETSTPILIDLSIYNVDEEVPFICEEVAPGEPNVIGNYEFKNSYFKYSRKNYPHLPALHQESIINRITTDRKIFNKITFINKIVTILIVISTLNFIRGSYDFYAKYINQTNGFGPRKMQVK